MDPKTTGARRGARVLATELTTVDSKRRAVEEVAGVESPDCKELMSRFEELAHLANELYPPFAVPRRRDRYAVGGERYPTFTQAVHSWSEGPGGGAVSGKGVYGLLCNDTHPMALAGRLTWRFGTEHNVAHQEVSIDYLTSLATAALSPYYSGLVLLAKYHGWLDNPALQALEDRYGELVPGALR
jgi:hypothetical protein